MATDVKVGDFVDVIFLEQSGKAVAQIVGVESAGPQGPAGVFTGHFQSPNGLYSLARCAPWRAKRRRVVRGRRVATGEAGATSRRRAIVGEPVYGSTAGRPRAVQAEPDTARLRRDRGREGDLEVPSRILRAGARLSDRLSFPRSGNPVLTRGIWIPACAGMTVGCCGAMGRFL